VEWCNNIIILFQKEYDISETHSRIREDGEKPCKRIVKPSICKGHKEEIKKKDEGRKFAAYYLHRWNRSWEPDLIMTPGYCNKSF